MIGQHGNTKGTFKCNGCGELRATSKEHLIHQAIGAVIFRDRHIRTEDMRDRLAKDEFLSGFPRHEPGREPQGTLFDDFIENLLCEQCNNEWANQLELMSGPNLYSFLHEGGEADGPLLRRWVWFFAIKMWWYKERTEALKWGELHPVLSKLANPETQVLSYTRVARLDADPETWRFGWVRNTVRPDIRFEFWLWGIAFFALVQGAGMPKLPFTTMKLTNGVTTADLPTLPLAALARLPEVRQTVG